MKKIVYLFNVCCLLFAFSGLGSCVVQQDEEVFESGKTYPVTLKVVTRSANDANSSDEETMNTLTLFFVDANNKVEEIYTKEYGALFQEEETVSVDLTAGAKKVYGFSNLFPAALSSVQKGDVMPLIDEATQLISNGYTIDAAAGRYLPMSNKININVANTSGQVFTMELIRLVSKIQLMITNETGGNVTLENIKIQPLTNSSVYLFPHSDAGGNSVLPSGTTTESYTHALGSIVLTDGASKTDFTPFYVNESATVSGDWFQIILFTKRNGAAEETRMALTQIGVLNRNDFLKLPLVLTDYKLNLGVMSYPPIGGYPAAVSSHSDGYHCVFAGGGPFIITPELIKISDGSVVPVADADWTFSYTDVSPSMFEVPPVLKNGEITGTIKLLATGKVLCTVSAAIKTPDNMTRLISYKVYIIQN